MTTRPMPPMLVMRTLHNTTMETRERIAVQAFSQGFATTEHFDLLSYMMNLLLLAGSTSKSRAYASQYAETKIRPVLLNIQARHAKHGKLGVTAQELTTLREFIDFSQQFWLRQPGELFEVCCKEVDAFFKECAEKRATTNYQ